MLVVVQFVDFLFGKFLFTRAIRKMQKIVSTRCLSLNRLIYIIRHSPFGVVLGLNFHVNASRKIQLHQRIYRLLSRLEDIQETLVSSHFELFTGLFIYMG